MHSAIAEPGVTPRCSFTEFRAEEDIFTLQLSLSSLSQPNMAPIPSPFWDAAKLATDSNRVQE